MSLMSILGEFLPLSLVEGGGYRKISFFCYDRRSLVFIALHFWVALLDGQHS